MKYNSYFIYLILFNLFLAAQSDNITKSKINIYDYNAISISGDTIPMSIYKNKYILLVNVASKCGYTSQYEELQQLHELYHDQINILGFPSNDYFWQERGTNKEIELFCKRNYGVTFPMFAKIHVKGKNKHPIYNWLSDSDLNGWNDKQPSWNFFKYLIDKNGNLISFFPSKMSPLDSSITNYFTK